MRRKKNKPHTIPKQFLSYRAIRDDGVVVYAIALNRDQNGTTINDDIKFRIIDNKHGGYVYGNDGKPVIATARVKNGKLNFGFNFNKI